MAELKPGWTRWYCRRCARPLAHDSRHHDTVTPKGGRWAHDQCGGGSVEPSMREFKA